MTSQTSMNLKQRTSRSIPTIMYMSRIAYQEFDDTPNSERIHERHITNRRDQRVQ